ncbi:unnamed protein product [Cuscuta epithymum]|uniref:Uncharacterized protein n=1 Tax=Cuscuta epithymum TaxID=186058 RepID=A0AAV0DM90_9ASTE|nr:unnamed protein product [Cuscuta epithymum]
MSSSRNSSSFHPALTISNIKNCIPLTLDLETSEYFSWAELFKITATAYQVLDHIFPTAASSPPSAADESDPLTPEQILAASLIQAEADSLWRRLDAVVLQWIYATISHDLLHTILEPDSTAQQAWERLADIFHDNKHSRAIYLEEQFSNTRLESFTSVSAYCKALKTLATKLGNVGSTVNNHRLVLRVVGGLPASYDTVASLIQQTVPLPPFATARSMLILEETRKSHQLGATGQTALLHTHPPSDSSRQSSPRPSSNGRNRPNTSRPSKPRGSPPSTTFPGSPGLPPYWTAPPPWAYWMTPGYAPWQVPPCPYPTAFVPPRAPTTVGILGPRPHQAHLANPAQPTDISEALHTLTLTPPADT